MLVLSILSLPAFIFYYSGNVLGGKADPDIKDLFTAFTIGNMGECKKNSKSESF